MAESIFKYNGEGTFEERLEKMKQHSEKLMEGHTGNILEKGREEVHRRYEERKKENPPENIIAKSKERIRQRQEELSKSTAEKTTERSDGLDGYVAWKRGQMDQNMKAIMEKAQKTGTVDMGEVYKGLTTSDAQKARWAEREERHQKEMQEIQAKGEAERAKIREQSAQERKTFAEQQLVNTIKYSEGKPINNTVHWAKHWSSEMKKAEADLAKEKKG